MQAGRRKLSAESQHVRAVLFASAEGNESDRPDPLSAAINAFKQPPTQDQSSGYLHPQLRRLSPPFCSFRIFCRHTRFEEVYGNLGKADAIVSAAAAHHRLLWIHPLLDGNGRVARLMSHAALLETLDSGAVWSVARGLARKVEEYKQHLANCDQPRRNDLDGRGHLSEEALAEFTGFFLEVCIDQVGFMEGLMQPDRLRTRIQLWAEEEVPLGALPSKAGSILEAVLYRGELPRGETREVIGGSERSARRVVSALIEAGVLTSESTRAPLRLPSQPRSPTAGCRGCFRKKHVDQVTDCARKMGTEKPAAVNCEVGFLKPER